MEVEEEDHFNDIDQQDIERIEENENTEFTRPDEAEEAVETARDVKPKKIITKPRLKLDDKRLKGPRGLSVLEPLFKDVVLKGSGYEKRDLDTVMSLLEHWAHRLFPKMTFDDCLEKIEDLGHKRLVSSYVTLLRMDCAGAPVENPTNEIIPDRSPSPEPNIDPFDQLLDHTPQPQKITLTQEQQERMERNQLLAMERRRAKLKAKYEKTADISESAAFESNTESLLISDIESTTEPMTVSDFTPNTEAYSGHTQEHMISSELDVSVQESYQDKAESDNEMGSVSQREPHDSC